MELLIAMALAYALSGGVAAGRATAAQHKTPKDPKPADRTDAGRKVAQGAINSVARIYTWTSGAREGWRKAWPETKTTISERRATVKAAKAERRAQREQAPAGAAGEPEVVDAEIVEDEPVNTGGPTAPTAETIADAKEAEAAARAAATVHVHVTTDPPPPDTGPAAAPVPPPRTAPVADAAGAPPSPAEEPVGGPHLRVVKDDGTSPTAPAGGGGASTPRSSMSTLPTVAGRVTEVTGVDSLMQYLAQLARWARMERDDATAAVTRLAELRGKAEHAYNAAAAAKYDKATLGELAAIVEKLAELQAAREEDLRTSDLAERNAAQASANVWGRHGGIQEARNQSDVDMAETTTYGD